jgi:hypothetical protein
MASGIAYVSQGKLYLRNGDGSQRTVESKFAQQVRDRTIELHKKNAWKSQGGGFLSSGMLWGKTPDDPAHFEVRIAGLSRGRSEDELLYTLNAGKVSGLFALQASTGMELRLFHTADFRLQHVAARRGGTEIACAVTYPFGISNIAIIADDNSGPVEITEGDSIDMSPTWTAGDARHLVYHSAGIARDASGAIHGRGPFTLQKLDLDSGEVSTLAEDKNYDLLSPRIGADSAVYYLRRPYRSSGKRPGWWQSIVDIFLMPFRLLFAIFQYLNWFTISYTGRMLTSAGANAQKDIDLKRRRVLANVYDAEAANREDLLNKTSEPGLVSQDWQLVRQKPGAGPEVLARGVMSFDVAVDGSIVYSNGSEVYTVVPGAKAERVVKEDFIEHVASAS